MSENINDGISGSGIDWNALNISNGTLFNPPFTATATDNEDEAEFAWPNDSDGNIRLASDLVVLVVVEPATKTVLVSDGQYTRADGNATLSLPQQMAGQEVQTYAFVKRADGSRASRSYRTGRFLAGSDLAGEVQ